MKIKKINIWYDKNDFQDFFINKYDLSNLVDNYFNYLDYENIFTFESWEYLKAKSFLWELDNIFIKAYEFYFEKFDNNLEVFSEFKHYFKKKLWDYFLWRYDILIDKKGEYRVIEFNWNTPWLITDIYHIQNKVKIDNHKNISKNFEKYILDTFKKYKWKKIWIILPYSYEDEDYLVCMDYFDIIKKVIDENDIFLWDIYETNIIYDNYFTVKWEKVDILLSFFPIEFFLEDSSYLHSFLDIIERWNLEIFNPLESIVLQDKLLLAVIWENIDRYSLKQQEFIKKHIAFTSRDFQNDEKKFIAKHRFGRVWRDIFENNFELNIDKKSDFIYQEKIDSKVFDSDWNIIVLWFFTNHKDLLSIIWRKQKEFVTKEWNNKVILCFKKV